jgi:hypothetical protein
MAYAPKYPAVIIVELNGDVKVKQYESSTEARLAYDVAVRAGKTAYYYFRPYKAKTSATHVGPMEVVI